jgi:RimJ/RimL family protein N-acetyltransferase
MRPPPYRIETERLVLRCWDPRDAALLKEAIDSSLEHLRPWMPWAHTEPQTLDEKVELLRTFRSRFDSGAEFVYGIFAPDESEVLGGTGLHPRGGGGGSLEIGYWIRASAVGRGLATEASAALTRVGFELCEAERLEIHVDPRNRASARIPRRLGYVEEATLRRRLPPRAPGEPRADETFFTLLREEYEASELPATPLEASDAAGRRLL